MIESTQKLDELLSDPVIRLVMASDGVQPEDVRLLMARAQDRAKYIGPALPPAHMIGESRCANWFCA